MEELYIYIIAELKELGTDALQLLLSMVLSMIIGRERGKNQRPAGARTHIIVCVSATLVMLIGDYIERTSGQIDCTRMAAQVISGIGFLGAGTILKSGFTVRGLTTAATLWGVACVGIAVGSGYYGGAILTTVAIYFALREVGNFGLNKNLKTIYLTVDSLDNSLAISQETVEKFGGQISSIGFDSTPDALTLKIVAKVQDKNLPSLGGELSKQNGIKSVYIE